MNTNLLLIAPLDAEAKPWVAQCEQCGIQYPNHAGSTPCCGSLAFIIDPEAQKAAVMGKIDELRGKERLLKKLMDEGAFKPKNSQH